MKPNSASLLLLSVFSLHLAATPPSARTEVLPITATLSDDADIQKVIAPLAAEIKATFDLPLVQAPQGLSRGRRGEENLLGYWVSDVMRQSAQSVMGSPVRFAVTNAGGLRSNLRPGQVKVGDIFELMPFENELVVIELTGAEVIQAVKESIIRRGGEPCSGVKTLLTGTPEAPIFSITWEDGSAIDLQATVKVATSDYLYGGGDSIPTLKKGRKPFTTGLTLRQILLDHCLSLGKEKKELLSPPAGRFSIPAAIQEAIRAKTFSF